jgi:ABC-type amino acid transport system permease subunit
MRRSAAACARAAMSSMLVPAKRRVAVIAQGLWISLCVSWIGLLLGVILGTGKTLLIAGAGVRAKQWQEATAFALIGVGSLGSALAFAALHLRWSWRSV